MKSASLSGWFGAWCGFLLLVHSPVVWSCSYVIGTGHSGFPAHSGTELPKNTVFYNNGFETPDRGSLKQVDWLDAQGDVLALVKDTALSKLLGFTIRRLPQSTNSDTKVTQKGCEDCPTFSLAKADHIAPDKPVIRGLRVIIRTAPVRRSHPIACPDLDVLELQLTGGDDRAPADSSKVLIWVGKDEKSVLGRQEVSLIVDHNNPGEHRFTLGVSGEKRDGVGMRQNGPFCFQVALMDWAGNVSERSEVRCLDTADENGPYAYLLPGSGCQATGSGQAPSAVCLIAFLCLLGFFSKHRKRHTA